MPWIPLTFGVGEDQVDDGGSGEPSVVTQTWGRRTRAAARRRLNHVYPQAPSVLDGATDFAHRVQSQYPWVVGTQCGVYIVSAITEVRP